MSEQRPNNRPETSDPNRRPRPAIDINQLAEKVYRLMLEEARLDRLRGAGSQHRNKR